MGPLKSEWSGVLTYSTKEFLCKGTYRGSLRQTDLSGLTVAPSVVGPLLVRR